MIIIMYILDSLRPDFLSCYGCNKETSPNIDKIAKEATLFHNAFAQSTWTRSSGASIFSSAYPSVHGVLNREDSFSRSMLTLPEQLKKSNFTTIAVSCMGNISRHFGFGKAFDYFEELYKQDFVLRKRQKVETKTVGWQHHFDSDIVAIPTSEDINECLTPLLEKYRNKNLFILVWSLDTHDPYFHRDTRMARFCSVSDEILWNKNVAKMKSGKARSRLKALYEDMIYYNDHHIGILVEKLKSLDLYGQTLFVITGDHGESFGEHGVNSHAGVPYEEQIKVPLIMKFPRFSHSKFGGYVTGLVQHIDLAPTILEYLGVSLKHTGFQGKSLLPLLNGQKELNEFVFAQTQLTRSMPQYISLRTISHKYIEKKPTKISVYRSLRKTLSCLKGRFGVNQLLFSLKEDPHEKNNIAKREKGTLKLLESLVRSILESNTRLSSYLTRERSQDRDMDEHVAKQLKALGYF